MTTPPNTYRQWLVGQALQGLLASGHFTENHPEDGPWYLKGQTEGGHSVFAVEAANQLADKVIASEKEEAAAVNPAPPFRYFSEFGSVWRCRPSGECDVRQDGDQEWVESIYELKDLMEDRTPEITAEEGEIK